LITINETSTSEREGERERRIWGPWGHPVQPARIVPVVLVLLSLISFVYAAWGTER